MPVTRTWQTAEQGMAAFEGWCLERRWPLVRVPTERDIGFDAFVQVTNDDGEPTGDVFGVQVKAGESYLRAVGAAVPVGTHRDLWRNASVPVIVVVHHPTKNICFWGNASEELAANESLTMIPARNQLPGVGEDVVEFLRSVRLTADFRTGLPRGLGSADPLEQCDAVWQAFALGFASPNALIALRRVIPHLSPMAATEAVVALSHCAPHPDIFRSARNTLPGEHVKAVVASFRWSVEDVVALLRVIDENGLDRGSIGQCVYMLIFEDPRCGDTLRDVVRATVAGEPELAGWAAYLAVAHAGDQQWEWNVLRQQIPQVSETFVAATINEGLAEWGSVYIEGFEGWRSDDLD